MPSLYYILKFRKRTANAKRRIKIRSKYNVKALLMDLQPRIKSKETFRVFPVNENNQIFHTKYLVLSSTKMRSLKQSANLNGTKRKRNKNGTLIRRIRQTGDGDGDPISPWQSIKAANAKVSGNFNEESETLLRFALGTIEVKTAQRSI